MARLKHTVSGVSVEVADERVDGLLARGFSAEEPKKQSRRSKADSDK